LDDVTFRLATGADAEPVADIFLESRKAFLGFAPLAHSDESVRGWIAGHLIPSGGVTVAAASGKVARLVGMMALSREEPVGWIDQLYLRPSVVGNGIGARFIESTKTELGAPTRLYTFQGDRTFKLSSGRASGYGGYVECLWGARDGSSAVRLTLVVVVPRRPRRDGSLERRRQTHHVPRSDSSASEASARMKPG
jgi:GNAT superfamily N-acetyltransferase